jgi:hypothetical protein
MFGILTLSFGILTLSFDRCIKLLLIDLKTSKRFEKKSNNGFVDCGLWIVDCGLWIVDCGYPVIR